MDDNIVFGTGPLINGWILSCQFPFAQVRKAKDIFICLAIKIAALTGLCLDYIFAF